MNGATRQAQPVGGKRLPLVDERPRHDYDGTTPFTGGGAPGTFQGRAGAAVTATFVVAPFAGQGVAATPAGTSHNPPSSLEDAGRSGQ